MRNLSFLFWAYNLVWGGIAAYLTFLLVRLRRVDARLGRIERRMQRAGEERAQKSRTS